MINYSFISYVIEWILQLYSFYNDWCVERAIKYSREINSFIQDNLETIFNFNQLLINE